MGEHAVNAFYNYVNTLVYNNNLTLLQAIRVYLTDNNIPDQYKRMNCVNDYVHVIANRYNNEMIVYNNYLNTMNNNNIADHGLPNDVLLTLNDLLDVQNMLHYVNH